MKHIIRISSALPAAITAIALSVTLTACQPDEPPVAPDPAPQDVYFERLSLLCGKAYSGSLASDQAVDADMMGRPMVMHVAHCDQNEIRIPFHVGPSAADGTDGEWDRSRTWIITRIADEDKAGDKDGPNDNLRLKHRHRHEDGSLDDVTNYGGDTASPGSAGRQEFPVDEESIALFKQEGLDQSVTNIWAVEISPPGEQDARFAYELRRPAPSGPASSATTPSDARFFRVEFDLTKPVPAPPPPWGDQD